MTTKVLYHANCNDGKAAALAAYLSLGNTDVEYLPVHYGTPPPDLAGCSVLLLDFSYKREVLQQLATTTKDILVIDHHKTAQADLTLRIPGVQTIFDMTKCGAVLTWKYFHPTKPIPQLFRYIQDRDLWTKELPDTDAVSYGLSTFSDDFRDWETLLDEKQLYNLICSGSAIVLFIQNQAKAFAAVAKPTLFAGHTVPVLNLPGFLISDTLNLLAPDYPFAASYFDLLHEHKRIYSLRSAPGGLDVSVLAASYGGGGHFHAAGFTQPIEEF